MKPLVAARDPSDDSGRSRESRTLTPEPRPAPAGPEPALALTIAYHPTVAPIGQRAFLWRQSAPGQAELSRIAPLFGDPGKPPSAPLGDPFLSRKAFRLAADGDGVALIRDTSPIALRANGTDVGEGVRFEAEEIDAGVVLELADRVVLVLHRALVGAARRPTLGLVGASDAIEAVRERALEAAVHAVPVLLLGETGTGKELLARALHEQSDRRRGPFVSVNVAAVPASTAASALFGHAAGSFTGASRSERGYFGMAEGGTLFLDEIGETPLDVQAALLRAVELGEIQPVGAPPRKVDVRLIAATDSDLGAAVERGAFKGPLLHRLGVYSLSLPPLRERRDDVGRLLIHFLRSGLKPVERSHRLDPPVDERARPWLPAGLVAELLRYDWPGNVRELRNVARQMVVASSNLDEIDRDGLPKKLLATRSDTGPCAGASPAPSPRGSTDRRAVADIDEESLLATLRASDMKPGEAARRLGISRTTLYALIERSPRIRKAGDLDEAEIESVLAGCGGDLQAAAAELLVSRRGLVLRMNALGMKIPSE